MVENKEGTPSKDRQAKGLPWIKKNIENLTGASPDRQEEIYGKLLSHCQATTSLQPVLEIICCVQSILLRNPQDRSPKALKQQENFANFLNRFISELLYDEPTAKLLDLNPESIRLCRTIVEQQARVDKTPAGSVFSEGVRDTLIIPASSIKPNQKVLYISTRARAKSPEEQASRDHDKLVYRSWMEELSQLFHEGEQGWVTQHTDRLIEILKKQPPIANYAESFLLSRNYNGVTLSEILDLTYPAKESDLRKITNYIAGAFQDPQLVGTHGVLGMLFFAPVTFFDIPRKTARILVNQEVLKVVSVWQERLIQMILANGPRTPEDEEELKIIFQALPDDVIPAVCTGIAHKAAYPWEGDPEVTLEEIHPLKFEGATKNPIARIALSQFANETDSQSLSHIDEITYNFAKTRLADRIEELATKYASRFAKVAEFLRKLPPYEQIHIRAMIVCFKDAVGENFLEEFTKKKAEVEEVTQAVWRKTWENARFFPSTESFTKVTFSEDSFAAIIGLGDISIMATDDQAWKLRVIFGLKQGVTMFGTITPEGNLSLPGNLALTSPGLASILEHIAILTVHDLLIAEQKRQLGKKQILPRLDKDGEEAARESKPRRLPRKSGQRPIPDIKLIEEVGRIKGYTPRRISMHRMKLQGAYDFIKAQEAHNWAVETGNLNHLAPLEAELQRIRESMHKPNPEKLAKLPLNFRLAETTDPLTGDRVILDTWVVEHISPKPTEEELKSPMHMYQKYYIESSSLAFLDLLRSWIVLDIGN